MHTRDFRRLAYFAQVAELLSVSGAAETLHVSPPVVSKALTDLEGSLETTLLTRGGRALSLTAEGELVYRHALDMIHAAERAFAVGHGNPSKLSGEVALTLPTELCLAWLPKILEAFSARHPLVKVTIDASDLPVSLKGSVFDLAIRATHEEEVDTGPGVITRLPLVLVCAERLSARLRGGLRARLAQVPFVGFTRRSDNTVVVARSRRSGRRTQFAVEPKFAVNNGFSAKELAKNGLGAALIMEVGAAEELRTGELVKMSPEHDFGYVTVRSSYRDRYPSLAARAFVEFLYRHART